jgi:hypothetical protein
MGAIFLTQLVQLLLATGAPTSAQLLAQALAIALAVALRTVISRFAHRGGQPDAILQTALRQLPERYRRASAMGNPAHAQPVR